MPKVDNISYFRDHLLDFQSDDDFYYAEIIIRKKDHPGEEDVTKSQQKIRDYFIDSVEKYDKCMEEAKVLCERAGARLYIIPAPKSYKKLTMESMRKLLDRIEGSDFRKSYKVFSSAASSTGSRSPWWVIDIDDKKLEDIGMEIYKLKTFVEELRKEEDVMHMIPTRSGWHAIIKPFDARRFEKENFNIAETLGEIKKNAPTLLYVP